MALMACPECEKQVSTSAETCPHCGYPIARKLAEKGGETQTPMAPVIVVPSKPAPAEKPVTTEDLYRAADKAGMRSMLIAALVLAVLLGGGYVIKGWWDARNERRLNEEIVNDQKKAYESQRKYGFYCFVETVGMRSDSFCWQGEAECDRRRVDHLRSLTGAKVTPCENKYTVHIVKFACKADPSTTCYQARQTANECETARERLLGEFNNVTECAAEH